MGRVLLHPVFAYLGGISYGLYGFHILALMLVTKVVGEGRESAIQGLLLAVGVTATLAFVFTIASASPPTVGWSSHSFGSIGVGSLALRADIHRESRRRLRAS